MLLRRPHVSSVLCFIPQFARSDHLNIPRETCIPLMYQVAGSLWRQNNLYFMLNIAPSNGMILPVKEMACSLVERGMRR